MEPRKMKPQKPSPEKARQAQRYVTQSIHWYQEQYRRVFFVAIFLLVPLTVSIILNFMLATRKVEPVYYAVTPDLRLVELTPLKHPLVSQAGLLDWATETVTRTFTLDFLNFRTQLMDVRNHYFKDCFDKLLVNLKAADILTIIESQRLNMKAIATQPPVITNEGLLGGVYTWKLQFPLKLSYESSKGVQNTQDIIVDLMIQRVPETVHPRGVRIKRIITKNK